MTIPEHYIGSSPAHTVTPRSLYVRDIQGRTVELPGRVVVGSRTEFQGAYAHARFEFTVPRGVSVSREALTSALASAGLARGVNLNAY